MSGTDSCPASSSLGRASDSSAMSSLGGVEGGWSHHADRDTRLIGLSLFVELSLVGFLLVEFSFTEFFEFLTVEFLFVEFLIVEFSFVDSKNLELICNSKL